MSRKRVSENSARTLPRGRRFKSRPRYKVKQQVRGGFRRNPRTVSGILGHGLWARRPRPPSGGLEQRWTPVDEDVHPWTPWTTLRLAVKGGRLADQRSRAWAVERRWSRWPARSRAQERGRHKRVSCTRCSATATSPTAGWGSGTPRETGRGRERGPRLLRRLPRDRLNQLVRGPGRRQLEPRLGPVPRFRVQSERLGRNPLRCAASCPLMPHKLPTNVGNVANRGEATDASEPRIPLNSGVL